MAEVEVRDVLALLKLASQSRNLDHGKAIHAAAVRSAIDAHAFAASALVNLYAKCGRVVAARRIFDAMDAPDTAAWNALLLCHAENGESEVALQLFREMQSQGLVANSITILALVKACALLAADGFHEISLLERAMALDSMAAARSLDSQRLLASLVDLYARCGSMVDAWRIFRAAPQRDVVMWTSVIRGFVENGQSEVVFDLFEEMQREGCRANARTLVALVQACTSLATKEQGDEEVESQTLVKMASLAKGMALHSLALDLTNDRLDIYLASCLVQMYARCGSMRDAHRVFDTIDQPNQACWTALILGCVENGQADTGLRLFLLMQLDGCRPDVWTFVCVLKACGCVTALSFGRLMHEEISQRDLQYHEAIAASLVDFYSRCGCMLEAERVFNSVSIKDAVTWSSLIAGYSRQGDSHRVLEIFEQMSDEGLMPDSVTYLSLLTTCSRAGLVEQGKKFFREMRSGKSGLHPGMEHYHCMIDMLGRARQIEEALEMAEAMPFEATVVTWTTLLGACSKWKNAEVGWIAFKRLVALDAKLDSAYKLMGNILADLGKWREKLLVEALRRDNHARHC